MNRQLLCIKGAHYEILRDTCARPASISSITPTVFTLSASEKTSRHGHACAALHLNSVLLLYSLMLSEIASPSIFAS